MNAPDVDAAPVNFALYFARHGLRVLPIPPRSKRPILKDWPAAATRDAEAICVWFEREPESNYGIATGGLVVVDVDPRHGGRLWLEDNEHRLPESWRFKTGGGGIHLVYRAPAGAEIGNRAGLAPGIDVRGRGGQIVGPGSVHPDGGLYTIESGPDDCDLVAAPAWLIELISGKGPDADSAADAGDLNTGPIPEGCRNDRLARICGHLARIHSVAKVRAELLRINDERCQPPLPRDEVERIVTSIAGREAKRQGARAPASGGPPLDPKMPLECARLLRAEYYMQGPLPTLYHYRGDFCEWRAGAYRAADPGAIRAAGWRFLAHVRPTGARVSDMLDALAAITHLPGTVEPPAWLQEPEDRPPADELLAVRNGLLHLPSGLIYPATPALFNTAASPVSYDDYAPDPKCWLQFLDELWPDDPSSIEALQDYFGYLLTPDTTHQKILLIVGPRRSGKGTIARTLTALLGQENVAGPTLAGLASNFGLQPLIGKPAAVIADARLGRQHDQAAITERLLSISGEDGLTIDRKYATAWTGKLPTRFVLLTNELPGLLDASGALASRFIVLLLEQSFLGREDHGLFGRIGKELPGILNWALVGYRRLRDRGHFRQPESAKEAIADIEALGSPVGAFVRERCQVGPACEVPVSELFAAWCAWCESAGRRRPGTVQTFGRDLRAAVSGLRIQQSRKGDERERLYVGIGL